MQSGIIELINLRERIEELEGENKQLRAELAEMHSVLAITNSLSNIEKVAS